MARYVPGHKELTRQRILERAAHRFKIDGVDGSGVSRLMADSGLTNGAFYAHFASKDDVVAAVLQGELAGQRAWIADRSGPGAVESLVRQYLSPEHRDSPGTGCPSAALLDEVVRSTQHVRGSYSTGITGVADAVLVLLGRAPTVEARGAVLTAVAGMIGVLQMARAITDPTLSDALLERGAINALSALGAPTP